MRRRWTSLTPLVYDELRRLARRYMRNERAGNTLQTTALVNEAYLRLVDAKRVAWQDRVHFFAVSAQMMRRILVDAARARGSAKRGGQVKRVNHSTAFNLDEIPDVSTGRDRELVAIDDALNTLAEMDPRKARVIELRFFGGLSVEETAEILKISPQSVMRDWKLAKAWLMRELAQGLAAAGSVMRGGLLQLLLGPQPRWIQFGGPLKLFAGFGVAIQLAQRDSQPQVSVGGTGIERDGLLEILDRQFHAASEGRRQIVVADAAAQVVHGLPGIEFHGFVDFIQRAAAIFQGPQRSHGGGFLAA